MPEISVIMPCFNAGKTVLRSVTSVLSQTFENFELIVVNDGSFDNTLNVLETIKDSRLKIVNQTNRGVSSARNKGIDHSDGNQIAFLDADDTWEPNFFKKMLEGINSMPDAALAYCGWQNVGLPGEKGRPYIPPDYEKKSKIETLLATCPWPIHAVLVHKWIVKKEGGFDERLANSEDYKLWLNIAAKRKVVRIPEVLAYYHFHEGDQATKKIINAAKANLSVKEEFLRNNPEIINKLGKRLIRSLTLGILLRRGYECYWQRDLVNARSIFRMVMWKAYGNLKDWKYMLPALLPLFIHRRLITILENDRGRCS